MFDRIAENKDHSSQFLSIIILLNRDNYFDIKSLLRFAYNRNSYFGIHNYLFQLRSSEALNYQRIWLRNAVFDFQTVPHETSYLNTLKGSTIKDELMRRWLSRTNITHEMRFYGLLYRARQQNISWKLSAEDANLLSRAMETMTNDSIQLKLFLPYVFPFYSQETIIRWIDTPVREDLKGYLISPGKMLNIKSVYDFFGKSNLSVTDNSAQLYEKILDTIIENFLKECRYTIHRDNLMELILYKDLFLPKIKLEKIQEKFSKILNFLKEQDHGMDWRSAGIIHSDPMLKPEEIAWKILTLLIPYIPEKKQR